MTTIGVIGAGAWGTALAQNFASHGHDVKLWARDPALADDINLTRQNRIYLRDINLHPQVKAQSDLANTCAADIILLAVPAQHLRGVLTKAASHIHHSIPVIVCSKGIELETGKLMSDVAGDLLPASMIGVLSGPNFAHEVAKGLPAAATLASVYNTKILPVRDTLSNQRFRIYTTNDVVGTEVGGAVKNVIAIICGIVAGRNLGENARAAAVTRGLHEIARLAEAMGGRRETLMGLSGIGDLILTCSSMQSRNFSLGYALGQGKSLQSILDERRGVTEGIPTAAAVVRIATRFKTEMPLVSAVHACLNGTLGVEDALRQLMERPAKDELGR
ncbi:MAG: NAD(P)-dependent glycerol-3-phosphate dehydrogenase [Micavibrio aeruginosavorus]|uniref:Glycerol-3-phosphate dehydrogenase [NAD(P)+] n=1 Tax=Micavibrio aeruginosavorus TaxID=349221 RepID=A0A7T5R3E1_9BACT|nr:MAG: NAD(P)-dependent glycerol-3-phosphate dehydrogenase [Micavibrio aeruginosavorus]